MANLFPPDSPMPSNDDHRNICQDGKKINNDIWNRIKFLAYMHYFVRKLSGQQLLGVGIAATCRPCLYYSLKMSSSSSLCSSCSYCQHQINETFFFSNLTFDFITINSQLSNVANEPFGYKRWHQEKPEWFDKLGIHVTDVTNGGTHNHNEIMMANIGLFYVLHLENVTSINEAKIAIDQYATGFFIIVDE